MFSVQKVPDCDEAFVLVEENAPLDMSCDGSDCEYQGVIPSFVSNAKDFSLVLSKEDLPQLHEVQLHVRCFSPLEKAYGFFLVRATHDDWEASDLDDKLAILSLPFKDSVDPAFAPRCLFAVRGVFHQAPRHHPLAQYTARFHSSNLKSRLADHAYERRVTVRNKVDPPDNVMLYQGGQVHLKVYAEDPHDSEVVGEEQPQQPVNCMDLMTPERRRLIEQAQQAEQEEQQAFQSQKTPGFAFAGAVHDMENRHQHLRGVIMGGPSLSQQPQPQPYSQPQQQPPQSFSQPQQQPSQSFSQPQQQPSPAEQEAAPKARASGYHAMLQRRMLNKKK